MLLKLNEFKNLTTLAASLQRPFSKNKPHRLMPFIIVFVGVACAGYKAERVISCKYEEGIIESAKIRRGREIGVELVLLLIGALYDVGYVLLSAVIEHQICVRN